jgi:predicted amino acid racemase
MLGDHPVAVGFLRRVECDVVAQIDGLASNSAFGSVIRHEAISKIVESLINEAKSLKLQGVIAFTSDETVKIRAEATGFTRLSHIVLSLTF